MVMLAFLYTTKKQIPTPGCQHVGLGRVPHELGNLCKVGPFFPLIWLIGKGNRSITRNYWGSMVGRQKVRCWGNGSLALSDSKMYFKSSMNEKDIGPEYSLEGLMLKLKLQYFGHPIRRTDSLEKTLMLGKTEGRRRRGDGGWDGWMASPTRWTWVWASSRSWWWTGKSGVLQSMGLQNRYHGKIFGEHITRKLLVSRVYFKKKTFLNQKKKNQTIPQKNVQRSWTSISFKRKLGHMIRCSTSFVKLGKCKLKLKVVPFHIYLDILSWKVLQMCMRRWVQNIH